MVDVKALKAIMVLKGFNQQTLVEAFKKKGYKISKNTMSAKLNNRSPWTIDDADMFIDVLEIYEPADKLKIFLP